jgi:UDP-N-acetylglucosamine 2-epimerase (hydrolysing)
MGESEKSVFIIGSPEVDIMLSNDLPNIDDVKKRYDILYEDYSIFIYHPITTELSDLRAKIKIVLSALKKSSRKYIVIYPNNDSGSNIIMDELDIFKKDKDFKFFPSLRFEYYITLMKNSRFIIGNSSAGVREAPVYGVPSINIGSRQNNRSKDSSIINVNENELEIIDAINNIPDRFTPSLNFGKGKSSELFMKTISTKLFWKIPNQKQFKDL